jgi:hypothetical protein
MLFYAHKMLHSRTRFILLYNALRPRAKNKNFNRKKIKSSWHINYRQLKIRFIDKKNEGKLFLIVFL